MKKSILIPVVSLVILSIHSCSTDEIDMSQTQRKTVQQQQERIAPKTEVNTSVFTKTIADTLSQQKNNRELMVEMDGSGDASYPTRPRK